MFTALSADISILARIGNGNIIADAANGVKFFQRINLYMWIPMILVVILVILGIFAPEIFRNVPKWIPYVLAALGGVLAVIALRKNSAGTGDASLDEAIKTAGYSYDPIQDIFYSNIDAWQKDVGYCRLYDESAAPMGMIIDCEPIYFEYENKRWMIEFWKGQYDLTTGCEIGVYSTKDTDIYIPGTFYGTFYYCADNLDQLYMSYSLKKNGKTLFTREGKHWWLTGFKLGEYSEPWELTMDLNVTLKNKTMLHAFLAGLIEAGYSEKEIVIKGNSVGLVFDRTRTTQPYTRYNGTDWIVQRKNKLLCDKYQDITGPYDNFLDKMKAVQQKDPELYKTIINVGKTKNLFADFEKIKKYLKK